MTFGEDNDVSGNQRSPCQVAQADSKLADRVRALLIGRAALLLARIEAIGPLELAGPWRALLARDAVVEAAEVLVVLFGAVWFVFAGLADRIALATYPHIRLPICCDRG